MKLPESQLLGTLTLNADGTSEVKNYETQIEGLPEGVRGTTTLGTAIFEAEAFERRGWGSGVVNVRTSTYRESYAEPRPTLWGMGTVSVSGLGSDYLTPGQARSLAKALNLIADLAENPPKVP